MEDLAGRVAFVTGGASGIGLGITRKLVEQGVDVIVADIRPDHLEKALASFTTGSNQGRVHGLQLDVTNRDAYARAADEAESVFGPVSILVNNAGVGIEGPLRDASYDDWDFGLGVNLGGVVNGLQTFLPRIRRLGRGGHVVNTASLAGMVQMPSFMAIYAAGKSAVIALSESLRDDLAQDDIGVTVLCPGPIKSNIHELARNRPDKFQTAAAFSEAAERLSQRVVSDLWMEPETVGDMIVKAIRTNQLYVITHGEWRDAVEQRHRQILEAMPTETNPDLIRSLASPARENQA